MNGLWSLLSVWVLATQTLAKLTKVTDVYPGEEFELDFSDQSIQDMDFVLPYLSSKWPSNATIKPLGFVTWSLEPNGKCFDANSSSVDSPKLRSKDILGFVDGVFTTSNPRYTGAFYYWDLNHTVVKRSRISVENPALELIDSVAFRTDEEILFEAEAVENTNITFLQVIGTLAFYDMDLLEEVVFYRNKSAEQVMFQILVEDDKEPVRLAVQNQRFWDGFEEFLAGQDSEPLLGVHFRKVNLVNDFGIHLWYLPQLWSDPGLLLLMSPSDRTICSESPCFSEQYLDINRLLPGQPVKEVVIDEYVLNTNIPSKDDQDQPTYLLVHVLQAQGQLYSVCLLQIPLSEQVPSCLQISSSLPVGSSPLVSRVQSKPSLDQGTVLTVHLMVKNKGQSSVPLAVPEIQSFVLLVTAKPLPSGLLAFSLQLDTAQTRLNDTDKMLDSLRQFDVASGDPVTQYTSTPYLGTRSWLVKADQREYFVEAAVPNHGRTFIYNTPVGESGTRREFIFLSTSTSGQTILVDSRKCWSGFYKGYTGLSLKLGESGSSSGQKEFQTMIALPMFNTYNPDEDGTYRKDQLIFEIEYLNTKLEIRSKKPDGSDVAPPIGTKTRAVGGVNTLVEGQPSLLKLEWDLIIGPLSYIKVPDKVVNPLHTAISTLTFRRFSWMSLAYRYLSESGLGARTAQLPWVDSNSEQTGLLIKTGEELLDLVEFKMYSCREIGWRTIKESSGPEGWGDPVTELAKVCSLRMELNRIDSMKNVFVKEARYSILSTFTSSTHIAALLLKNVGGRSNLVHFVVSRTSGMPRAYEQRMQSATGVLDQDVASISATQILLTPNQVVFLYLEKGNLTLVCMGLNTFNTQEQISLVKSHLAPDLLLENFYAVAFNPKPAELEVDISIYGSLSRYELFISIGPPVKINIVRSAFRHFVLGSRKSPSGQISKVCRTANNLISLTTGKQLSLEPDGDVPQMIFPALEFIDLICYDAEKVLALVTFQSKSGSEPTKNIYAFLELVDSESMATTRQNSARLLPFAEIKASDDDGSFKRPPGTLRLVQAISNGVYFATESGLHHFNLDSEPVLAQHKVNWTTQSAYQPGDYSLNHTLLNVLTGETLSVEQVLTLQYVSASKDLMETTPKLTFLREKVNSVQDWKCQLQIEDQESFRGHMFSVKYDSDDYRDSFTEKTRFQPLRLFARRNRQQELQGCLGVLSDARWSVCLTANYTVDMYSWEEAKANVDSERQPTKTLGNISIVPPGGSGSPEDWKQRVEDLALVDLTTTNYKHDNCDYEVVKILFTAADSSDQVNPRDRAYLKVVWMLSINVNMNSTSLSSWSTVKVLQNLSLPMIPNTFSWARHGDSRYILAGLYKEQRSQYMRVSASNCAKQYLVEEAGVSFYHMFEFRNRSEVWILYAKTTVKDMLYVRIFEMISECSAFSREIATPFKLDSPTAASCTQSRAVQEKIQCVVAGITSTFWIEIYALFDRDPIILKYTEFAGYKNLVPSQLLLWVDDRPNSPWTNFFILSGKRTISNITDNPDNRDDLQGYDSSVLLYFPMEEERAVQEESRFAKGGLGVFDLTRANLPEICSFKGSRHDKGFIVFVRRCGESGDWEVGERLKPVVVGSKRPDYFEVNADPGLYGQHLGLDVAKARKKLRGRVFGTSIKPNVILNQYPIELDFLEENKNTLLGILVACIVLAGLYGLWVLRKRRIVAKKRVLAKYENFERSDLQRDDDNISEEGSYYQGNLVSNSRSKRTQTVTEIPGFVDKGRKKWM